MMEISVPWATGWVVEPLPGMGKTEGNGGEEMGVCV